MPKDIEVNGVAPGVWVAKFDGIAVSGRSPLDAMRALFKRTDKPELVARAGQDTKPFLEWVDAVSRSEEKRKAR